MNINVRFRNSRLVNYNRWSEAKVVTKLAEQLVIEMKQAGLAVKIHGYVLNMKTLLVDLYHSYMTDKDQYVAYSGTTAAFNFKPSLAKDKGDDRYNGNPHISFRCFTGCVQYLVSKDYIEDHPGGQFREEDGSSYGYLSRMRAKEALVALCQEYGFEPEMISLFKPEESIILKDNEETVEYVYRDKKVKKKIKRVIDYLDTAETKRMRKVVNAYNDLLARTYIDVDVDCMAQTDKDEILDRLLKVKDKSKYTINLGAKRVYRVFNNASFKEGGRFYGAWWIGCPSIIRKYITIGGEPTVELDYSGIHIYILYALKRLNFADFNTDAYELVENDPDRALNKLILLTAYNADSQQSTAKAVFKDARDEGTLHTLGLKKHKQVYNKLDRLKQKHPHVQEYIAAGVGRTLQYHDSKVLELLILHFTKHNIPILTVHDSIICQAKYSKFVLNEMLKVYSTYVNRTFRCRTIYYDKHPQAALAIASNISNQPQYRALPIPTVNPVLETEISYEGKIPEHDDSTIKVKAKSSDLRCSNQCASAIRKAKIKAGSRIFLGKIKLEYQIQEGIATLQIEQ
jgi:hypothetical protein